jgi:Fe-S-cluster-containing hydrogenase component 2
VPGDDELREVVPSPERLARRRVAVVECFQEIPCDPCADACPFGAIAPFTNINDRPEVLAEACVGCGLCLSKCPGLAIFMVDLTLAGEHALVTVPYEMLPVPSPGDSVAGLDREGRVVTEATVAMVQDTPGQDRTRVVWLRVPREWAMSVRGLRAIAPVSSAEGEA